MTSGGGFQKRSKTVYPLPGVDVRAVGDQQFSDIHLPITRGQLKSAIAPRVLLVDVGALRYQHFSNVLASRLRSGVT